MKLLLLNKDPVAGATWINPDYLGKLITTEYNLVAYEAACCYPLLNLIDNIYLYINSGQKIRFQKSHKYLNLPKGLNEF